MNIPTRSECLSLWDEFEMPENIRRHTETVTRVAVFLAERLSTAGELVNVPLVEAAGLLHDIAKYQALSTHEHHGRAGKRIIEKKGYPEVARVISMHAVPEIMLYPNLSWEEQIVNYADRRVNHDRIVTLDERFAYLRRTYPGHRTEEEWNSAEKIYKELEKKIFSMIHLDASRLEEYINEAYAAG